MITGLMGILKSRHKSYKLIKLLKYYLTIITFSQVIILIRNRRHGFWHMALTAHFSILLLLLLLFILLFSSSDDIQPSTVLSDQLLCESLCGH